jgi:phage terminase large subunit
MQAERIRIPHEWQPRPYQMPLWSALEGEVKRAVAVWHRRAGKDEVGLHWTACAAMQAVGNYWHMLPEASQARKAIWEAVNPHTGKRRTDEAFPSAIRSGQRDDEMIIRFKNGSTWQVVGSDNYDSLVGATQRGIVFSEYALAKPAAWNYLQPILAENGGWALFIYTSRGRNHGADLYEMAKSNPKWFAQRLTVEDTNAIPLSVIEEDRKSGMSDDMIRQEYYCSFDASTPGAYYGSLIEQAEQSGRIGSVPYDPSALVSTAWDLGYGDDTAIWFCQTIRAEPRIIDYYENRGVGLDHYAKVLKEKPYVYHKHLLPHDGAKGELIAGTTIVKQATALLGRGVEVLPRLSVEEGINAARVFMPRCRFDDVRCAAGIKALRMYRRAWSEDRKAFADKPLHDWTSHAADAFRYLAIGFKPPKVKSPASGDSAPAGWLA